MTVSESLISALQMIMRKRFHLVSHKLNEVERKELSKVNPGEMDVYTRVVCF